jgi:transcriptional regulator with XRE-family HTH domain
MPSEPTLLDPEDIRVGATIQALRRAYGLTQFELGRAIGKSQQLIGLIESGERRATPAVCKKIADTLGVPLAAITVAGYAQMRRAAS